MTEHDFQAQINRIELHQYPDALAQKLTSALENYGIEVGYGLYTDENRYRKLILSICDRERMEKHVLEVTS